MVAHGDSRGWRAARCPDDANATISRRQKRFFPIETPFAAVMRPRTRSVAPVPTQGDDNRRDDHV
jgi:hypothetical protein